MDDACIAYALEVSDRIVENIIMTPPYACPGFDNLQKRIDTFQNVKFPVSAVEMRHAGFFFTGRINKIKCYCCGITLSGLSETTKPWELHAYFASKCVHVRVIKGDTWIERVKSSPVIETVEHSFPTGAVKCSVCLENVADILLIPCRHLCMCGPCKMNVATCPICRVAILAVMTVFVC